MTIRNYLDGLILAAAEQFTDKDRQMSMADVGVVFSAMQAYAAQHKDLPMLPYDKENE